MKKYLPHISILAAGILWGMIGLFNRNLIAAGFTPSTIVLVRNFGEPLGIGVVLGLGCILLSVYILR